MGVAAVVSPPSVQGYVIVLVPAHAWLSIVIDRGTYGARVRCLDLQWPHFYRPSVATRALTVTRSCNWCYGFAVSQSTRTTLSSLTRPWIGSHRCRCVADKAGVIDKGELKSPLP